MSEERKEYVAVFGTLRRGCGANYMMGNDYVGTGVTGNSYLMTCVGFPKIARNEDGLPVLVEVYRVPVHVIETVLDSYEGVPHLYTRERDTVRLFSGEVLEDVNIYVATRLNGTPVSPVFDKRAGGPVLDWLLGAKEAA